MAFRLMVDEFNKYVGGLENGMMDYEIGSDEYESCKSTLENHDMLKKVVYVETIGRANQMGYAKHIKFAGKEFLMERIEKRLLKNNL